MKAILTGITGQDASYLSEILLDKGYEVHGLIRRSATNNKKNISHLLDKIILHDGDLSDTTSLYRIINEVKPDEVYNFACMAGVSPSFKQPEYTMDTGATAVISMLEILKQIKPNAKFFQASSSHIFGSTKQAPQTEKTSLEPVSPYGVAKASAHHIINFYRTTYNIFACSAIFYAHASSRYSESFLLGKIVHAIWDILNCKDIKVPVGNITIPLDVGFAPEYAMAAFNIMQQEKPDDFIICTGEVHEPREFIEEMFKVAGLDINRYLVIDDRYNRGKEVNLLVGDYSKANKTFGYEPKVKFKELAKKIVEEKL